MLKKIVFLHRFTARTEPGVEGQGDRRAGVRTQGEQRGGVSELYQSSG